MKRRLLIFMTALILLVISPLSHGQKQVEIKKMSSQLNATLEALMAAWENINQMRERVPEREWLPVNNAMAQIERASDSNGLVRLIALIASNMRDPRDYQTVLSHLKISCDGAKRAGDAAVQSINTNVVLITSSALIAEFIKARDLIQSLRSTPLCAA